MTRDARLDPAVDYRQAAKNLERAATQKQVGLCQGPTGRAGEALPGPGRRWTRGGRWVNAPRRGAS